MVMTFFRVVIKEKNIQQKVDAKIVQKQNIAWKLTLLFAKSALKEEIVMDLMLFKSTNTIGEVTICQVLIY